MLADAGVTVRALPLTGSTPEKIRLRSDGRVLLRLDRGDGSVAPSGLPAGTLHDIRAADAILVSDYGNGVTRHHDVRTALTARPSTVWDPHPRGADPMPATRLVTPNEAEAFRAAGTGLAGSPIEAAIRAGYALRSRWQVDAVAVTRGAHGAALCTGGQTPFVVPARESVNGDACGAGDRFAVTAALALGGGALASEAVQAAVRSATEYVVAGGAAPAPAAAPVPRAQNVDDLIMAVRSGGGTVVATGGCFDLLHPGHIATLQAARRLGDCLIVCLNSDSSVERLKGPERPLNPQQDRAHVLTALDCVDAVVVFDEPTPIRTLEWLRPDIWVKGGDYAEGPTQLPEADTVRRLGGRTVTVPYIGGYSTTHIIRSMRSAGPP
jgi:rfaE bifunctional protein nucleotidyltransferase chain/domain